VLVVTFFISLLTDISIIIKVKDYGDGRGVWLYIRIKHARIEPHRFRCAKVVIYCEL
jgi:hypothetical protein